MFKLRNVEMLALSNETSVFREKQCYITVSTVDFERFIKQCMESVIAFYQNVRYGNDDR